MGGSNYLTNRYTHRVALAQGNWPADRSRPGGLEIAAVILLLVGGFVFIVGWVVGCVLLWASPRWRWADKLLGTLIWPGGLALPLLVGPFLLALLSTVHCGDDSGMPTTCATGPPPWVGIAILAVLIVSQVGMAVWLLRRARSLPDR